MAQEESTARFARVRLERLQKDKIVGSIELKKSILKQVMRVEEKY